jgi:hypothetical protein
MTQTEMQLDSTDAGVEADASIPAAQPARPETVAETLAKTLQSFEGEADEVEETDTLPEPPEPDEQTDEQPDEPDAEVDEPDEAEAEEDEPAELEALAAPNHWPKDFAGKFEALEPAAQHMFMERYKDLEGDYTRKTQEIAKYRKRQQAFDEIMQPHKADFERAGMDEVAAVRQLLAAHDYLRKDPANAINWLANQYGVDVGAIGNDPALEDEYADPQVKALQQQVAQLTGFIQNQQTQQQSQVQASTQSLIDQFAAETDANGNPKHPHFERVRGVMGTLISSENAKDLNTAYEMAVYADPELRQEQVKAMAAAQSQDNVKTEAVKKAKKAARSKVRGSATPAAPALPANASIRDTIQASIRQLENGRS